MAETTLIELLRGEILEQDTELSLSELCRASRLPIEGVLALVEHGVIEPLGGEPAQWRFRGISLWRARAARRLGYELGLNTAGVALAIELLEEIERLRARLRRLEG